MEVIRNPEATTLDNKDAFHFVRMGAVSSWPRHYLEIIITYSDETTGRRIGSVRTAHFNSKFPKGALIL